MKMDKVAGSGNDEFYTPEYAVEPILEFVPNNAVIKGIEKLFIYEGDTNAANNN